MPLNPVWQMFQVLPNSKIEAAAGQSLDLVSHAITCTSVTTSVVDGPAPGPDVAALTKLLPHFSLDVLQFPPCRGLFTQC